MIDLERLEEAARYYRQWVDYDAVHNMDDDLACHRRAALDALETVIEQQRNRGGWSEIDFRNVSEEYGKVQFPEVALLEYW